MASINSHISWTDSTWNPTTGCTKVSAGCENCYAEALTNRLFGGNFHIVKEHADRIGQAARFTPLREEGKLRPRMVFVNSMSDLMHEDIADSFRDKVFAAMDSHPNTIFQVLTKRPMTLRRYISSTYRAGLPRNIWLGVSVEDNKVRGRVDILRRMADDIGNFTSFLSVEPLIGMPDRHDYSGISWVLIGGESGPKARECKAEWIAKSVDLARAANSAVWFKQFGKWPNNPLYAQARGTGANHLEAVRMSIASGEKMASVEYAASPSNAPPKITGEKGGATLDGKTYRELPQAFHDLAESLNPTTEKPARARSLI